jgi:hypothetical protein
LLGPAETDDNLLRQVVYDGTSRRARCAIRYRIRTRRGRTERMAACEAAIR